MFFLQETIPFIFLCHLSQSLCYFQYFTINRFSQGYNATLSVQSVLSSVNVLCKFKIFWDLISCFLLESFMLPWLHLPRAPQHLHLIILMEKLAANLWVNGRQSMKMLSEVLLALEEEWQAAFVSESLETSATLAASNALIYFLFVCFRFG